MLNSRIVIFIVAFLCIAIGVVGILPYINDAGQTVIQANQDERPEPVYTLWFSHKSFEQGDPVSHKALYAKKVRQSDALAYGFDDDVTIRVNKGMVANQAIKPNTPITQSLFSSPGDADYIHLIISPDFIPYSFSVSDDNRIGDVIQFNDRIDILALTANNLNLSKSSIANKYNSLELTTVLSGIRVLGINTATQDEKDEGQSVSHIIVEFNQAQLAKFLVVREVANIKVIKHIRSITNPYRATISSVFPEQREIRQLRGKAKEFDPEMVILSEPRE